MGIPGPLDTAIEHLNASERPDFPTAALNAVFTTEQVHIGQQGVLLSKDAPIIGIPPPSNANITRGIPSALDNHDSLDGQPGRRPTTNACRSLSRSMIFYRRAEAVDYWPVVDISLFPDGRFL